MFPCVDCNLKTQFGEEAYNPDNLLCTTVKRIKNEFGNKIGIISDVALDPYTSHGHDGIFVDGIVQNDVTIESLCKQALVQAAAGVDIVAPSDMMDGRIKNIRHALDLGNFANTAIISYSSKYCSVFYSPFRDAIGVKNNIIDKSSYQMDCRNRKESMIEIASDIKEGADMVMIKPAMMYTDIIRDAEQEFAIPIFAYQVSGEYSMLYNFGISAFIESLNCLKRAGARAIFTYAALDIAEYLNR